MRNIELEQRILAIVDRVEKGLAAEDSLVELKSEWPTPVGAARQLAGHCNAARGEPVLWVIGVDEKQARVTGATNTQQTNWFDQVKSCFDQEFPELLVSLSVKTGESAVIGLLFDSGRCPYVVRNPAHGKADGGPVSLEVPWRSATGVASARRDQLLRLLTPAVVTPTLELLEAEAHYTTDVRQRWNLVLDLDLFASVRAPLTIVAHRTSIDIEPAHMGYCDDIPFTCRVSGEQLENLIPQSWDVRLYHSAHFSMRFVGTIRALGPLLPQPLHFKISVGIADLEQRPTVSFSLTHTLNRTDEKRYVLA